jgi:hypothetical protein
MLSIVARFGGDVIGKFAIALTHGSSRCDGRLLHHPQEFRCEIAFQVAAKGPGA